MDIATILLAASATLGTKAVEESTKFAIAEAWSALKSALKRKRGPENTALDVLDDVERLPAGEPPRPMLVQRLQALKLGDDAELAALVAQVAALVPQQAQTQIRQQNNITGGTFHNITFNS